MLQQGSRSPSQILEQPTNLQGVEIEWRHSRSIDNDRAAGSRGLVRPE
jgi:hypothetical protein